MLGLLHGPAELLPISSSAHTTLVAWLARWRYPDLEPAARKRFEVALHAGGAVALLAARRRELRSGRAWVIVLGCAPAALAGLALRRPIERHLGTPATIAAGLAGGSLAMALGEARGRRARRSRADARVADALALGAAQAVALIPGVSRDGATRAAARWRGFGPAAARALSDEIGLPITLAAVALEAREAVCGADRAEGRTIAAGATAAFASTLAGDALLRSSAREGSLTPFAAYRMALAAAVVRRLRENSRR